LGWNSTKNPLFPEFDISSLGSAKEEKWEPLGEIDWFVSV